ncbi:hypothetical protein METSCH_D01250 [Metschnikowia aff. pulcherrima]|uniref:Uncharacterized protein n=1 Tax=Metschnikowia aff. pulcherrima TaxID=2163413 RepID=A0A4P6XQS6_9ASCO|nr:hypothetical protein METSCH_D01250 [Metschnikowia aff. pulcherrima]
MEIQDPLPLIQCSQDSTHAEHEYRLANNKHLASYGYLLIALTGGLFLTTINTLFECWRWVIHPLKIHEDTVDLYNFLELWFERLDYVIVSLWCIYVVAWWWALFSWVGIKLFRHSKGIQT